MTDLAYERFRESRQKTYARLDELRSMMEDILNRLEDGVDLIPLIAQYEGLRAERIDILARYQTIEDQFINHVLGMKADSAS
jgi:hypothetical protein